MENDFLGQILNSDFMPKLIAFVVAIQLVLFAVAEALTRISVITENKWDNDLAQKISKVAWFLGVMIGKFGYSTPKLVIEEKSKKVNSK
jgi:hypothetical protein